MSNTNTVNVKAKLFSTNVLFPVALILLLSDVKLSAYGVVGATYFLVGAFLGYSIAWELAHMLRARQIEASDSLASSLSLIVIGGFFYFGKTDKALDLALAEKGQGAVYGTAQWVFNDVVLLCLSIGVMMGLLVLFVAVLSYISRGNLKASVKGSLASILVGILVGIVFGCLTVLDPPNASLRLAPAIALGCWVSTAMRELVRRPKEKETDQSKKSKPYKFGWSVSLVAGFLSALFVWLMSGSLPSSGASAMASGKPSLLVPLMGERGAETLAVFLAVGVGALVQAVVTGSLQSATSSVEPPEQIPNFIPKVGWYCERFLGLMVAAPVLLLLTS